MVALTGSTFALDSDGTSSSSVIPPEASMVMTALEAGGRGRIDHRQRTRRSYRVEARLRLFSDPHAAVPWVLYTRDGSRRALGFVSPHRLPLGYGGIIELVAPDGKLMQLHCTLLRCRQAAPGWFEGCVYFNREQPVFD